MEKGYTLISTYSGAGGLDLGFKKAGFRIIYATDNWELACKTLELNKSAEIVECNDIRNINFKEILKKVGLKKIDVLIGGPPCPPYSKSRFYLKHKKRGLEDEEGSYTLPEYFRAIKETNPTIFFFENVPGFAFKPHKSALDFFEKESSKLGYNITYKIVNAADYGIPQIRERFICVGVKKNFGKFSFPDTSNFKLDSSNKILDNIKKPWITAGEAIRDLDYPLPEDERMIAGSKHKDLLKEIPPGENYLFLTKERGHKNPKFKWRSRYWSFLLKLSPNKPSWTIQASHSNNMGPFHWNNRFLRISELKRLQTFPDDYKFVGDYKDQWRLIGNAVPPLLAEKIAKKIIYTLERLPQN